MFPLSDFAKLLLKQYVRFCRFYLAFFIASRHRVLFPTCRLSSLSPIRPYFVYPFPSVHSSVVCFCASPSPALSPAFSLGALIPELHNSGFVYSPPPPPPPPPPSTILSPPFSLAVGINSMMKIRNKP